MKRRTVLTGVAAVTAAAAAGAVYNYVSMGSMDDYDAAAARSRKPFAAESGLRDIVRYASLAANSHNTQPWIFGVADTTMTIRPDASRRTPVVDPDDHHLFVSLGCAAANIVLAGAASGRAAAIAFDPSGDGRIDVDFTPATASESDQFRAIATRQCTRSDYDGRAIVADQLALLEKAAAQDGAKLLLVTGKPEMESVLEQIIAANRQQMADAAFVQELKSWLRFNPAEALRTGDGLFSACSGNPVLPGWLGRTLFSAFFTEAAETDKIARQVRSSSGFAIFASERDDRQHWFKAGMAYQRFALQATALGIRNAHLNQPVEVAAARPGFAAALGLGSYRPDLVIRFGAAPSMPMSLRRSIDSIIG